MSVRLIKGGDRGQHGLVQNFDSTSSVEVHDTDVTAPPLTAEGKELQRLRVELAELKRLAEETQIENLQHIERIRAETREECSAEFQKDDRVRIEILKAGVSDVRKALETKIVELEKLSLSISEVALEGIFGREHMFLSHLKEMISAQLQDIRRESVIEVLVSPIDFENEHALSDLAAEVGQGDIKIRSDADIQSGAVHIRLRLGHVEISLPNSWKQVQSVLSELSEEGI